MNLLQTIFVSPAGPIYLVASEKAVMGAYWKEQAGPITQNARMTTPLLAQAIEQLTEYFAGVRRAFDLPLDPQGTEFQKRVWSELAKIPYGTTVSYKEIAIRIGNQKAVRAVGLANGRNPISIFIPCHRVIGSSGRLTGYAGGLGIKTRLLEIERTQNSRYQPGFAVSQIEILPSRPLSPAEI